MKYEKIYSDKFLKNLQILDNRKFDEDEYNFLKPFFDEEIIDNILEIIDDIFKNKDFRYIILGDFLFSMTSLDIRDPSEILFKTNRNAYIERIRLRANINTMFNVDFNEYINKHKKLLIGLRLAKILGKTETRSLKDNSWETIIYFHIKIKNNDKNYTIPISYGTNPFVIVELFKTKYSVTSFRNLWKIKRRKREMEDIVISYHGVIIANQIKFYIPKEYWEVNKSIIEKEKESILKRVNCSSIDDYLEKTKQIIIDINYTRNLVNGEEKIEDTRLKVKMRSEHMELMNCFQKIITFIIIEKNIFDRVIYLPCFIDNRGRQYYATLISPTFYKIFRYLYEFHEERKIIELESSEFYKKVIKYKSIVSKFNLNDRNSYIIIVLFIEIGKHFIKTDENYFVRTEDIIRCGIINYMKRNIEIDFEEKIYLNKMYLNIEKLINNSEINNNVIIFKDATASGLQNYGIILGYKEEMLKYLNIDGDDWCDTYKYLIEKNLSDVSYNLRKRKYWKNTIMTIPYNAVWYSCFIKFIENLKKDGIEYKSMKVDERENIRSIHKSFYKNIKENIKKEFYKNENNNIKEFKYNKWDVVNKKDYKITYKKAREKYTDVLYMITEDKVATERALEANNMHYMDAKLVHEILNDFEIMSIHDCFGVRLSELHLIMDKINAYYSEIIKKKTYSIHIIK